MKWLTAVLGAAILFSIFGLPYFSQFGHPGCSILVYAFLFVAFLYGRANRVSKPAGRELR